MPEPSAPRPAVSDGPGRRHGGRSLAGTRRQVLRWALLGGALGTGLALTGCGDLRWDDVEPPAPLTPGPDELARRRAVTAARELVTACGASAAAAPALAPVLDDVATQHVEHLAALGSPVDPATPGTGTDTGAGSGPAPDPSGAADGTGTTPPVPPADAESLATVHTAASAQALADTGATAGPLARLLALLAAARAVQAHRVATAAGLPAPSSPAGEVALPAPSAASPDPTSPTTDADRTPDTPPTTTGDGTSTTTTGPGSSDGPGTTDGSLPGATARALRAAVDGEYAAAHGYGVVAARLEDPARETARAAITAHRDTARALARVLRGAGATAPAAAPAYRLPGPVGDAAAAAALAAGLESALVAVHADLVAHTEGPVRAAAAGWTVTAALAAHGWGAVPTALPGGTGPRDTTEPADSTDQAAAPASGPGAGGQPDTQG